MSTTVPPVIEDELSSSSISTTASFFGIGGGDDDPASTAATTTSDYGYNSHSYYDHEITTLSDNQEIVIIILQMVTATLSIVGSSTIIAMAYKNNSHRKGNNNNNTKSSNSNCKWSTYTRLLVMMSISDIVLSTSFAITAFLLPEESSQRVWAFGTDTTCTIMGFLLQLSSIGILYNGMLSYYFVLAAKYKWTKHQITKYAEPLMHFIAIGYPLITSIWGAIWGVYHETELGQTCWVANYPENCGEAPGESGIPCQSTLLGYIFGAVVVGFTFFSLFFNNLSILLFMRKQSLQIPTSTGKSSKVKTNKNTTTCIDWIWKKMSWIPSCFGGDSNSNCNSNNGINNETRSSTGSDIESSRRDDCVHGCNNTLPAASSYKRSSTTTTRTTQDDANPMISSKSDDNDLGDYNEEDYCEDDDCDDEDFLDENEIGNDSKKSNNYYNRNGSSNINQQEDDHMTMLRKKQLKRLQLVASQSYLYVAAFLLSSIWPTLVRILESLNYNKVDESKLYPILICQAIFFPLQGLFNLLVFARPRYIQYRIQYPTISRMRALQFAIHGRAGDDHDINNHNGVVNQQQQQPQQQQQQPCINEINLKGHEHDHGVEMADAVAVLQLKEGRMEQQKTKKDYDDEHQLQPKVDQEQDFDDGGSSFQSTTQKLKDNEEEEQRNHAQQQKQQGRSCFVRIRTTVSSLTTTSFDLVDDIDEYESDKFDEKRHCPRKVAPICKDSRHRQQQNQYRPMQHFSSSVSSMTASINEEFNNEEVGRRDVPILPAQRRRSILRGKNSTDSTSEPSLGDDETSTVASSSGTTTKRVRFSTTSKLPQHAEHPLACKRPVRFQTTMLTSVVESHQTDIVMMDEEIDMNFDRMGAISGNSNHTSSLSSSNNSSSNDASLKVPERRHSTGSSVSSSSAFSSTSSFDDDDDNVAEQQAPQLYGGDVPSPIKSNTRNNLFSGVSSAPPKPPARNFRGYFPPRHNLSPAIQEQVGALHIHGDTIQPVYIPSYNDLHSNDSMSGRNGTTAASVQMRSCKKSLTAKGA